MDTYYYVRMGDTKMVTLPSEPGSPHFWGFQITIRQITLGRTPLDE